MLSDDELKKALQKGSMISIRDSKKGIDTHEKPYSKVDFNAFDIKLYHLYNTPIGIDFQKSYIPSHFLTIRYILNQVLQLPSVSIELRYKCEQLLDSYELGKVTLFQSIFNSDSSFKKFHDPMYPISLLEFLIEKTPYSSVFPNISLEEVQEFLRSSEKRDNFIEKWQKHGNLTSDYPYFMLVVLSIIKIIKQSQNILNNAGCNIEHNIQILDQIRLLLLTNQWPQIQELLHTFPIKLPLLIVENETESIMQQSINNSNQVMTKKIEKKNKEKKEKEFITEKVNVKLINDDFVEDMFTFLQCFSSDLKSA